VAKKMLCSICGTQAKPKVKVKGSIFIEIVLWICLIIPGLIYSLWRSTSAARYKICPACGQTINMMQLVAVVGADVE
jgi:hypothetical protein